MATLPHHTPIVVPQQTRVAAQQPQALSERPICPAAARSFTVGLVALRVCWLPGVNCLLALASIALGALAIREILHSRGALGGMDEAISGTTLGVVVLGLSVFFISALTAAWHR
ncbi:MAG TPA: hypothetical protein VJA65_02565 [bacterium]|jgi:hypothetical protein|nr:hypothetical protein [bacterium]